MHMHLRTQLSTQHSATQAGDRCLRDALGIMDVASDHDQDLLTWYAYRDSFYSKSDTYGAYIKLADWTLL